MTRLLRVDSFIDFGVEACDPFSTKSCARQAMPFITSANKKNDINTENNYYSRFKDDEEGLAGRGVVPTFVS